MARFDVIPKNGGTARYSGTPTFTGTYMKPGMLEFREVASPTPIEWTAGDYVVYSRTGYTYRLYTVPRLKKQARSNSYGGAYIYQGVQFFDDSKQLEICPFRDLVLGDNRIHFSTQPSISTFEGVDGIARRLQACLDDMYPNTWYVRLATTAMGASQDLVDLMSEAREFTVSGVSLLGALDKVYEVWPEVGWVFTRGQVTINGSSVTRNIITIGGGGLTATSSYLYGKGNGLLSITRTVANAEELANRIFAYGSSRNMLPRWYNSQNIKDADSVDIQNLMIPVSEWGETDNLPDAAKAFVEDATSIARLGLRPTTVYFDGTGELPEIYPTIRETTIKMVRQALGSSSAKYYPSTTVYTNQNVRVDRLMSAPASFDDGLAGEDGKSASVSSSDAIGQMTGSGTIQAGLNTSIILSSKNHTITKTRETDLSVSVSGDGTVSFSSMGGYAYIAVSIQKGDGTDFTEIKRKMFDLPVNSDGDFMMQDAYVRINDEDVTIGDVIRVYVSLFLSNSRGDTSLSYSYTVEPNVSFSAMWSRKKTFFVGIRQVGFDISEQALLGDGKTIAMRSGKCAGRSFSIKSCSYDSSTDSWVLECWRSEDESLAQWFPNTDYPVRGLENAGQSNEYPGDEFVILDIAMPDIYVQMAEQRLLDASEELLADTATERWQYIPEIDAKFMVENSRTIVAGQNMTLQDADIIGNSSVAVLVDSITISEGEAAIPTYKVTLRDRKRKTWTDSGSAPSISSKPVSNATQESIQSVSNSVADSFFELDENGDVTLKPQYANLWVSGFLTAGGRNSGGGGGGGGDVSYLNDLSDVTAPSPSSGDLLSWSGSAWVNVAQSTITPDLSAYALKTGADTYDFLVNSLKFKNTGHDDSYISADIGTAPLYYTHQRLKWTYSMPGGTIGAPDVTESKYIAFLDDIPSSLKNPYKLTFGSKEYDGSAAVSLAASDIGALTSHQTVTLTGGTNNGTLKLTVGGTATDNIAVTGLGSLAYKSSLVANDIPSLSASKITSGTFDAARIPDLSDAYVTKSDAQTISGVKTFTGGIVMSGADIVLGNADHIDIGPVRLLYDSTAGCLRVTTNQTGNNAPIIGLYADGQLTAGGVGANGSGGGGYGVESITTNQDGTVDFHFTGGDVTTVDLNHTHPNYYKMVAESTNPSGGFLPDVVYELGTLTGSVTFTLASAVSGNVNHYFWTFTAGSTAPTITWPSGITWAGGSAPSPTANKKYEISVLNNVAAYLEV